MEELTASLATSFQVTYEPNSTAAQHPRYSEYKQRGSKSSQQDRRKLHLQLQKQRRYDYSALARNLAEGSWENIGGGDNRQEPEDMECDVKLRKPGRHYRNQLMFSEWLVEVPEDFETEWTMVICPVGRRVLVVASRGSTSVYAKNGYKLNTFPSLLPGGNSTFYKRDECAILDCILDQSSQTFFVLDLMCWKTHPMYDSETEFRFYWMQTKFAENPEILTLSKLNKYRFLPLPCFPCKKDVISSSLSQCNFSIDGLLFYHKRTHYNFGSTPLVVWLKPYMLPEMLDIHEPAELLAETPDGYKNYATHMEEEKTKCAYGPNYHRKIRKKKKDKMEVQEGETESTNTSVNSSVGDDNDVSAHIEDADSSSPAIGQSEAMATTTGQSEPGSSPIGENGSGDVTKSSGQTVMMKNPYSWRSPAKKDD